jgi:hypothetical protein
MILLCIPVSVDVRAEREEGMDESRRQVELDQRVTDVG